MFLYFNSNLKEKAKFFSKYSFLYFPSKSMLNSFRLFVNFFNKILNFSVFHVLELFVFGVGFKLERINSKVILCNLGYSHNIYIVISENFYFRIYKQYIALISRNWPSLTQLASRIRALKIPDPYKGKGIRYLGELVTLKKGKQKQR